MSNEKNAEQVLHCWADRYEEESKNVKFGSAEWAEVWIRNYGSDFYGEGGDHHTSPQGATCLLSRGHDGPHQWTPDDGLTITFAGVEAGGTP